jgi:hypothetical protein
MCERVVWGPPKTGALVKFHSYTQSLIKFLNTLHTFYGIIFLGRCLPTTYRTIAKEEGRPTYPPVSWKAVSSIDCYATFTELLRCPWGFTCQLRSCTQTKGQNWDQEFRLIPSSLAPADEKRAKIMNPAKKKKKEKEIMVAAGIELLTSRR